MGDRKPGDPSQHDAGASETLSREELSTLATPPGTGSGVSARGRLQAGRSFGSYQLTRLLGKGGFGEVWEAHNLETGRRLALKVLTEAPAASAEGLQRFHREARLAGALNHPRCVFVFGSEEIEEHPCIVMELIGGGTLQDRLGREGRLPPRQAVDCILDVIDGLAAAHRKGIVHRDVKPSNCFVDEAGRVRVGDFGLAKALELDAKLTMTGTFLGTPAYSSPEQVRGREVDVRSDLYSVGATLYALLTGRPPFGGAQPTEVLARILSEPPTPFAGRGVPRGLERVVLRLLAKDPERRYSSHSAVRAALLPFSSRGLTPASLPNRFLAYMVDSFLLLGAWRALAEALVQAPWASGWAGSVGFQIFGRFALPLPYFALLEGRWGTSLGKRLFDLRVTTASGSDMNARQALLRTLAFFGAWSPAAIPVLYLPADAYVGFVTSPNGQLVILASIVLIASTMRASNGFAGLHERISGTRVTALSERSGIRVPERKPAPRDLADRPASWLGPYLVTTTLWETASEALLLAHDPVLDRDVWIHRVLDGAAPTPASTVSRPGQLRWLQGSSGPAAVWDAYEAPSGIGLPAWVEKAGRLRWAEMREILIGLVSELNERRKEGRLPSTLSVHHVWVDAAGQAKLLEFPASHAAGELCFAPADWQRFLHQLLLFGLEGRIVAGRDLGHRLPLAPLPPHSREIVQSLCGRGEGSLDALTEALLAQAGRPAAVDQARRGASLALSAFLPALGLGLALVFFLFVGPAIELCEVPRLLREWKATAAQPEARTDAARRDAVGRLLSRAGSDLEETLHLRVSEGVSAARLAHLLLARAVASRLSIEQGGSLRRVREAYPSPGERDLVEARRLVQPEWTAGRSAELMVGVGNAVLAATALLLSFVLRGGLSLSILGITVQTTAGAPASRARCATRAFVVWSPLLAGLSLFVVPPSFEAPVVLGGLLVGGLGTVHAARHPEAGIQDLVCGTRLVPT